MDKKNPRQGELAGAVSFGRDAQPSTTKIPLNPTIIDRAVVVTRGIGNLFMVTVQPAVAEHPPMIFDSHKQARGYASGLRLCHRWQVIDQTREGWNNG